MRTFDQLGQVEQDKAKEKALDILLQVIAEGGIRFSDALNHDNLQARIDAAWDRANEMQTPWFVTSYIMDTCADDIRSMAGADAEDALYPDPSESIIRL